MKSPGDFGQSLNILLRLFSHVHLQLEPKRFLFVFCIPDRHSRFYRNFGLGDLINGQIRGPFATDGVFLHGPDKFLQIVNNPLNRILNYFHTRKIPSFKFDDI